jgi:hypothetical protein
MADPSNGITFRTIQEAMPEYHIWHLYTCSIIPQRCVRRTLTLVASRLDLSREERER